LKGEVKAGIVRSGALSWKTSLPDGPALFSLRPEQIRMAANATPAIVRVSGRVLTQAFHGATELIRVECSGGLILTVRTASGSKPKTEVELEFDPADAIAVSDSPERI
jgi:hypothetical protein